MESGPKNSKALETKFEKLKIIMCVELLLKDKYLIEKLKAGQVSFLANVGFRNSGINKGRQNSIQPKQYQIELRNAYRSPIDNHLLVDVNIPASPFRSCMLGHKLLKNEEVCLIAAHLNVISGRILVRFN